MHKRISFWILGGNQRTTREHTQTWKEQVISTQKKNRLHSNPVPQRSKVIVQKMLFPLLDQFYDNVHFSAHFGTLNMTLW